MPLVRPPHANERDALLALWERAVRATHHFLAEKDIAFYRPMVREFLASPMELWIAAKSGANTPLGFMGLDVASGTTLQWKVEALFVDPAHSRQGIGTLLLRHARLLKGRLRLDVNEQNEGARLFYSRLGFLEAGRSPCDGAGKPFPLIHMAG